MVACFFCASQLVFSFEAVLGCLKCEIRCSLVGRP